MKQSDKPNSRTSFQVIGVSPYLISGAQGHYESFHKALYKGLQIHEQIERPLYLGSRKTELNTENWYLPVVPSRLTSKFKVADLKYFRTLLELASPNNGNSMKLFVTYEGGLFAVFLFSALLRLQPKAAAIVNIFDNQQHANLFESKFKTRLFKILLNIAISGVENRLVLTGDTLRFASKMQKSTGIAIELFPMFSILQPSRIDAKKSTEFLINLRGLCSADKLLEVCEIVGNQNLPKISVHGPIPKTIKMALAQFDSLEFSEGHISENDYQTMFYKYENVIFLYNPESFSYCSSGRLFDAIIAGSKLIVPSNTALSDSAKVYGYASEFDFCDSTELVDILLGKSEFSYRSDAPSPTVQNATESLILLAEKCQKRERSKSFSVRFWIVVAAGWCLSVAGYVLSAAKYRTKNRVLSTLVRK